MQADANQQRRWRRPRLGEHRALNGTGRRDCLGRLSEHAEEAVALAPASHDCTAMLLDTSRQKRIVSLDSDGHRRRRAFPEWRTGFDVSEQEGDRSSRKVRHLSGPSTVDPTAASSEHCACRASRYTMTNASSTRSLAKHLLADPEKATWK